ncbi:30S ribosomal protein S13 [Candidatus Woesearchaeota archaeon]|nr:30S ribosomal protein S13 [Candidatus Woesearchaeota archaeon]
MAEDNFNQLVRVVNVDLDGNKPIFFAMIKIKGIDYSFANAVLQIANIDKLKRTGYLTDEEVKRISDIIENPQKNGIPLWMLNRRKDYSTGEDQHILSGDIKFIQSNDIRRMQKIKSRRGLRHQAKLPVRGQRTKSNFRKGTTLGVRRKAPAQKSGKKKGKK